MKKLAPHPNVIQLLGCVTKTGKKVIQTDRPQNAVVKSLMWAKDESMEFTFVEPIGVCGTVEPPITDTSRRRTPLVSRRTLGHVLSYIQTLHF